MTPGERWKMDEVTGIPFPVPAMKIHDLQEPVTTVTRDERILFSLFRCRGCGVELRQPRSLALDHEFTQWALEKIVENCKRIAIPHKCKIGQVGIIEFVMAIVDDGTPGEIAKLEREERYQAERRCR